MGAWEDAVMGMYHSPYKFDFNSKLETLTQKCRRKNLAWDT